MSRSYKKNLIIAPKSRYWKRLANRIARRPWNWWISDGNMYRRLTNPYNICDYWFRWEDWGDDTYWPKWKWRMK
jgi:hypothetical protein